MMQLNLKARVLLRHVVAVGVILLLTSWGADWGFSRIVLGQVDEALIELAATEASAAAADPTAPIHIHEKAPGTAPPSMPRLDKFLQIVDLDGHVVARSANLGTASLPVRPATLARLRAGERVFETMHDFAGEPVRLLSTPTEVGGRRYAVQVGGSLDDANAVLRDARLLLLAMGAAILAAVVLTGGMLARTVLGPIDRIVRRAQTIGQSGLSTRLPHPGTTDEMGRLVETLNEMLGRIEQGFEAQRRFTADASHELRSPLSRLRAELEVTLRRPRDPGEYEQALASCLGEVERLSRLTEELLMLARLDAGQRDEARTRVPLGPIINDAVERLTPAALGRGVRVVTEAPPEVEVTVAPAAAGLVLTNVLDNAVKFSPAGGEVRVTVSSEGRTAVIAVSDSGPGVPEDEIPRLFERFYRGGAARASEAAGVGLGLSICQALLEQQGGGISMTSRVGHGSTVRISLPLAS
jgi:two-component system, OmpR family, sensor kinase